MPPRTPIWEIEPHTKAKHQILRKYWQAWLPIMTRWNKRVLYIDGFAGPGEYAGGEPGSPIVALDEAIGHQTTISSEVVFLFIEDRKDRFDHLEMLLAEKVFPPNFKHYEFNSKFDQTVTQVLDQVDSARRQLAPTFALIDPFGYSQTPFNVVKRLLSNSKSEALITFVYESIDRFASIPSQSKHLDNLFGTDAWQTVLRTHDPNERLSVLYGIYKTQLEQEAGAKYVLPFKVHDSGGKTEYFLFFCTNDLTGLSRMKTAMYSVDPSGSFSYSYSDNTDQLRLFEREPDFGILREELGNEFVGKEASIEEIEEFVLVKTSFLATHYKKRVLTPMEKAGSIEVIRSSRKGMSGYPKGTIVRFLT